MSLVLRRRSVALLGAAAALATLAVPTASSAHDPIILTAGQTSPEAGPLLLDGTVSFAVYGTLLAANDRRGFRARFRAGDTLTLTLLLPDLEPERSLPADQRPALLLTAPDGSARLVPPGDVSRFSEPITSTAYVRYLELSEPASSGDYGVSVLGRAPARFTVAIGRDERFGTPVNDITNRSVGVAGVEEWYATPPPAAVAVPVGAVQSTSSTPTTSTIVPTTEGDVVEETVPPVAAERSPEAAVVLVAAAVVVVGLAVVALRRRRR